MRRRFAALAELLLGADEPAALRQRLLSGVAGLLSLRVAFGAMAFVLTITLARLLGRAGVGTYTYALAWVTLLGAPAILGMDQLLVREIPAYQLRSEWGLMRGLLRVATTVVGLMSLSLIGLAVAVSWALRGRAVPDSLSTLWVALILVPLIALTRVRQGTLQGLHRVVRGSIPERIVLPACLLVLLAAAKLAHLQMTASMAMGMNVLATGLAFGVGAWMLHRNFPAAARQAVAVYRTRTWLRSALPILLLNGVGVVLAQADILIVGSLKGVSAVGLYGVADKSSELLSVVLVAQSAAFASTAAALYAGKELVALQRLTTRIARLTFVPMLPLGLVFLAFGRQFLGFFYGADFTAAHQALAIASVGQIINVAAGLNGMLLIMTRHPGEAVKAVAASALTNVVLSLLLVPRWGINGAAIANLTSTVVLNVLASTALVRKTGLHSSVLGGGVSQARGRPV